MPEMYSRPLLRIVFPSLGVWGVRWVDVCLKVGLMSEYGTQLGEKSLAAILRATSTLADRFDFAVDWMRQDFQNQANTSPSN